MANHKSAKKRNRQSLKRNKVKFFSPPLASDYDNVKTCFCYDPDFNLVQLVQGGNIKVKV